MADSVNVTLRAHTRPTVIGQRPNGRAIMGHEVSFGPWRTQARTLPAARAALAAQIEAWDRRHDDPIVLSYGGRVAVLLPDPGSDDGWTETSYRPDGSQGCVTGTSATSRRAAEARARYHLVQAAVTDWSDDDALRAGAAYLLPDDAQEVGWYGDGPTELYRYAAWQRAARHAMDAGRADFHSWASEHAQEFTPAGAPGR